MTRIPRFSPLDLGDSDTIEVEVELSLPRLTSADQELATRQFSGVLHHAGILRTEQDMQRMVELTGRFVLHVATKLVSTPKTVLSAFREERYEPWHERVCEVVTLRKTAEKTNERAIYAICEGWKLTARQIEGLSEESLVIVASSLSAQGRLPLNKLPTHVN